MGPAAASPSNMSHWSGQAASLMVGTLSLKKENMIYVILFRDQIKTGTFREKKFRPANALFFLLNIFVQSSDI